MAAKKKSARKVTKKVTKQVTKQKTVAKAAATNSGAKKATAKKSAKKATAAKAAGGTSPSPGGRSDAPKAKTAKKSGASSLGVNLGHVFALRPRVETSFRPADFATARRQLEEESFESAEEAARAVAEKALELTHGGPASPSGKPRRW